MNRLALAVPVVIFGCLYVLAIVPARHAAASARAEAMTARASFLRAREERRHQPALPVVTAPMAEARTPGDLAAAVRNVAGSAAIGGVEQLAVEISGSTVSASFDARYSQIDRFFSSLDEVTGAFDVKSVDIVPAPAPSSMLMRATVVLQAREPLSLAPAPGPMPVPATVTRDTGLIAMNP